MDTRFPKFRRPPDQCRCPCHRGVKIFCSCFIPCCDEPTRKLVVHLTEGEKPDPPPRGPDYTYIFKHFTLPTMSMPEDTASLSSSSMDDHRTVKRLEEERAVMRSIMARALWMAKEVGDSHPTVITPHTISPGAVHKCLLCEELGTSRSVKHKANCPVLRGRELVRDLEGALGFKVQVSQKTGAAVEDSKPQSLQSLLEGSGAPRCSSCLVPILSVIPAETWEEYVAWPCYHPMLHAAPSKEAVVVNHAPGQPVDTQLTFEVIDHYSIKGLWQVVILAPDNGLSVGTRLMALRDGATFTLTGIEMLTPSRRKVGWMIKGDRELQKGEKLEQGA